MVLVIVYSGLLYQNDFSNKMLNAFILPFKFCGGWLSAHILVTASRMHGLDVR